MCRRVAGTKKRKKYSRMSDARKKIKLMCPTMGTDCKSLRQCFPIVLETVKTTVLKEFKLMQTSDLQDSYLCTLLKQTTE